MNYETAAKKYIELRDEVEQLERECKSAVADKKKLMGEIATWFQMKAQSDGLKTVPTTCGTVYWSTHSSAKVSDPDLFIEFVKSEGAWDLMETRAAKVAVKSYIEGHGEPPPGVSFSSVSVFNLKQVKE